MNEAQNVAPVKPQKLSEEQIKAAFSPFSVKRSNQPDGPEVAFVPAERTRGNNAGTIYAKMDNDLSVAEMVQFIDEKNLEGILSSVLNKAFTNLWDEATDDQTGETDLEKFQQLVADLSLVRETLSDLQDRQQDLYKKAETLDRNVPDYKDKLFAIYQQIHDLNAAIMAKKKPRKSTKDEAGQEEVATGQE